jgi:DNA-binding transcriptional ArsR family regulator
LRAIGRPWFNVPVAAKPAIPRTRLLILRLLADRRMTLYELARELGRAPGSVRGTVHRMTEEGWLLSDSSPPVRGSEFWLNPMHMDTLEEELANDATPGVLQAGQQVVLADAADRLALYALLARPAIAGSIAWVADFDGAGGRLIALDTEADEWDTERLVHALQDAGIAARTGRLGAPKQGDEVRRFAAGVRGGRKAPA